METSMNSSTASEASAVVSNVITEPVNPTARTIYSVVTAQPVIEGAPEQVSHVSRGNRRASKRMRRSRKRSRAQQKDAEAEAASYKRHTHVKTYKDKMRNFRKNVVRDLEDNDGIEFLKPIGPDFVGEEGWDLDYYLDIEKIEANPEGFFIKFSHYLASLKHKKLKKPDGSPMSALHDTLKQTSTAINNLWKAAHRKIPFKYKSLVAEMLSSKKKKEKKLKAKGDIPEDNGRDEMSFELYRELSLYYLRHGNVFAHLFLILCWNTMVRNCNCDDIVFENCIWRGDCFGISVKRTKTNQDGSRDIQADVKHIYANPLMPEVCPILALAMYFLANPFVGNEGNSLFPGKDRQVRFNNDITAALKNEEFQKHLRDRGIPFHNVGAYSTRKGSTTYCTSGTTCGPSIISVCLRAGWAIGETLSRYLKKGDAGDQFCGRVVCGLPQLTADFAILPPHFKPVDRGEQRELITGTMQQAFPFSKHWGVTFEATVYYMLASLVQHQQWIQDTLPFTHPVRQNSVFMGNTLPQLKEFLAQEGETTLLATGVPVWCKLFININRIQRMVKEVREELRTLPAEIKETIREAFVDRDTSNGTASFDAMNRLLDEKLNVFAEKIQQSTSIEGRVIPVEQPTPNDGNTSDQRVTVWVWAHDVGRAKYTTEAARYLPKDFRLSYDLLSKKRAIEVNVEGVDIKRKKITAYDAWSFWWKGMKYGDKRIRPLVELQSDPKFHFFHDNAMKRYNDMKQMCVGMVELMKQTGSILDVASENELHKMMLFKQGWLLMCKFIRDNHPKDQWKNRVYKETVSYTTLKKHYYEAIAEKQHLQRLKGLVVHLEQDHDGSFLTNAIDQSRNWTHSKMLDLRRIQNDIIEFCIIFTGYLQSFNKRDAKTFLKSTATLWKQQSQETYEQIMQHVDV